MLSDAIHTLCQLARFLRRVSSQAWTVMFLAAQHRLHVYTSCVECYIRNMKLLTVKHTHLPLQLLLLLLLWFDCCESLTDNSLPPIFFPFGTDQGDSVVRVGRYCNSLSIPYKIFNNYRTLYVSFVQNRTRKITTLLCDDRHSVCLWHRWLPKLQRWRQEFSFGVIARGVWGTKVRQNLRQTLFTYFDYINDQNVNISHNSPFSSCWPVCFMVGVKWHFGVYHPPQPMPDATTANASLEHSVPSTPHWYCVITI